MKAVKINSTRISSKINIKKLKWAINYLQIKIKKNIYLNNEKVECILIDQNHFFVPSAKKNRVRF